MPTQDHPTIVAEPSRRAPTGRKVDRALRGPHAVAQDEQEAVAAMTVAIRAALKLFPGKVS
jgi:hypothetical protein